MGFAYHSSHSKVKASDSINFYNQTSNSRAAVLDKPTERAERLAKQDARARTRSSSGAFAGECAELPTESRELCTAARRCRGYRGIPPVLLFFCRRFLFQIKRKCRNAENIKSLTMVGREGRVQIPQIHTVTLTRQRVVGVADPYKPR